MDTTHRLRSAQNHRRIALFVVLDEREGALCCFDSFLIGHIIEVLKRTAYLRWNE